MYREILDLVLFVQTSPYGLVLQKRPRSDISLYNDTITRHSDMVTRHNDMMLLHHDIMEWYNDIMIFLSQRTAIQNMSTQVDSSFLRNISLWKLLQVLKRKRPNSRVCALETTASFLALPVPCIPGPSLLS
jgi:hypothetical protein